MKKIYILDGYNLIYRMFFAIKGMTLPDGSPINAVFGIAKLLFQIAQKDRPDELYFVIDSPGGNFREDFYPDYKAQRSSMPEDLRLQEPLIWKLLEICQIPIIGVPRYEADDIMATLVQTFSQNPENDIYMLTGDKDLYQFVGERVAILDSMKQIVAREKETIEKFGVPPALVCDYLAICGDSSDNIPGIPGFGPKKAQMLLTNYGNLDDIYRRIDEIPSKYVEALLEHKEIAYLSRKLATICQDVPLQLDFSKHHFHFDQLLTKEVQNLFQEWNFRSLLDKIADNTSLEQTSLFLPEEPQKGEDIQVHEISPKDLEGFLSRQLSLPKISLEITGDAFFIRSSSSDGYHFARNKTSEALLATFLSQYTGELVSYDLKAIYRFLLEIGQK